MKAIGASNQAVMVVSWPRLAALAFSAASVGVVLEWDP